MFRSLGPRAEPVPTLRPIRAADYSVLLQSGGPMFLSAHFQSLHVIGIPLTSEYAMAREGHPRSWAGRLTLGDVSVHPVGPGQRLSWPEGATCLYVHLRPTFLEQRAGVEGVTLDAQQRLERSPTWPDAVA